MDLLKNVSVIPHQLKNAFDKLFDDLMEDKTREMEPAEVRAEAEGNIKLKAAVYSVAHSSHIMSLLTCVHTGGEHATAPTSKAGALMDDLA